MDIYNLNLLELVAIDQAAHGLISGRLKEWPALQSAFKALNVPHHSDMNALHAKNLAGLIYSVYFPVAARLVAIERAITYCGECGQSGECPCLGNWRERAEKAEKERDEVDVEKYHPEFGTVWREILERAEAAEARIVELEKERDELRGMNY